MSAREFKESPFEQGLQESIAYVLDVSNWPGSSDNVSGPSSDQPITSLDFEVKTMAGVALADTDVLSGAGSASDSDNEISTPLVLGAGLTDDTDYRIDVRWVRQGNTWEAYGIIQARE